MFNPFILRHKMSARDSVVFKSYTFTMTKTEALKQICDELVQKHKCHTIILYGPQADPHYDGKKVFDLMAFRDDPQPTRDMQAVGEEEYTFSTHIHPLSAALTNPADFLEVSEGKVILEKGTSGQDLIKETKKLWQEGPDALPAEEREEIKTMILQIYDKFSKLNPGERARQDWLHKGLIEFYFSFRRLWYLDYRYGYDWLQKNDPETYDLLIKAQRSTDPAVMNNYFKQLTDKVIAGTPQTR